MSAGLDENAASAPCFMTQTTPALDAAIAAVSISGILIGHRLITVGDECALRPDEFRAFASSVMKVQRASGAARIVARHLLAQLAAPDCSIVKSRSGAPVWPSGIVGSLAHDADVAVAAIARQQEFSGVGIDIEPAVALDRDLVGLIATDSERAAIQDDPLLARVLFAVKEAVYKAVYPLDGQFLNHHDVDADLVHSIARVRNGRVIMVRYCIATHILALAFIPAIGAD
jgi:4'-phosphopantetheinyl transferase EntD